MTTRVNKEAACMMAYTDLQKALTVLGETYCVHADSILMSRLQDAIANYADAEIALHTHEGET